MPFYWGGSIAYPVISLDNSHATLTVRPYRADEPAEVPRDLWAFARWENGKAIPDPGHLYLKDGFKPGWLYDLVYVGKDPKLTGLGFAAIRDVTSFFIEPQTKHSHTLTHSTNFFRIHYDNSNTYHINIMNPCDVLCSISKNLKFTKRLEPLTQQFVYY